MITVLILKKLHTDLLALPGGDYSFMLELVGCDIDIVRFLLGSAIGVGLVVSIGGKKYIDILNQHVEAFAIGVENFEMAGLAHVWLLHNFILDNPMLLVRASAIAYVCGAVTSYGLNPSYLPAIAVKNEYIFLGISSIFESCLGDVNSFNLSKPLLLSAFSSRVLVYKLIITNLYYSLNWVIPGIIFVLLISKGLIWCTR